jgi:hypothetical protein
MDAFFVFHPSTKISRKKGKERKDEREIEREKRSERD